MIDVFGLLDQLGQTDTAVVEPFLYLDGSGVEHYGPAQTLRCFRESRRRLVLDSSVNRGAQLTSDATVYLPAGTVCPAHSRVTLTDGAGPRQVVQVLDNSGTGLPTPDHLEVLLV